MISTKDLWNEAAKPGLILGGVSIAYMFATMLTGKLALSSTGLAFVMALVNVLLWIAKFVGCIYLLKLFLQTFKDNHEGVHRTYARRFGWIIALLSALVYSAGVLLDYIYIQPEAVSDAFDTMMASYSSFMTASDMELIDNMRSSMPVITFFTNLIYCTLFGTILTNILVNKVYPKDSIFDEKQ